MTSVDDPPGCGGDVDTGPVLEVVLELVPVEIVAGGGVHELGVVRAVVRCDVGFGGPGERPVAGVRGPELGGGDTSRQGAAVGCGFEDASGGVADGGVRGEVCRAGEEVRPGDFGGSLPVVGGAVREECGVGDVEGAFDDPLVVDFGEPVRGVPAAWSGWRARRRAAAMVAGSRTRRSVAHGGPEQCGDPQPGGFFADLVEGLLECPPDEAVDGPAGVVGDVEPPGEELVAGPHVQADEESVEEVGVERVAGAGGEPEQHGEAASNVGSPREGVDDDVAGRRR